MTKQMGSLLGLIALGMMSLLPVGAQQNPAGLALPNTAKVADRFTPLMPDQVKLTGGMLGTRYDANEKHRMLTIDENDLLDAFERRNVFHQDWQGEHIGKYLHAATQVWASTKDPALKSKIDRLAARLMKTQEPDGYLGTYKPDHRWKSWDVWVHKYDLIGLLTYYQYTGNKEALATCRRVGDLLVRTFGTGPGQRDINRAGEHVGMAADSVLEAIVLLYRATDDPRYLQFAHYIVSNYDAPGGPAILASLEKYHSVRRVANAKAYEMTSNFNGLLELYRATGDKRLLADMETAWNDIVQNRLYLTGSASSFEVYQDDFHLPNGNRSNICETCVTVTWEQMNLELLRLTGDGKYAAQAERSIYNHLLGAQKPTGDDWAYYTPLEGIKPYDNFTTCCHSSGPRGIALIPSVAWMTSDDGGLVVNLYNSASAHVTLPKAGVVTLTEQTDYPLDGNIAFKVSPEHNNTLFPLRLRVPEGVTGFDVKINEKDVRVNALQGYITLNRRWKQGDTVRLNLSLQKRFLVGDHENLGRAALQYGPLVLTLDTARNDGLTNLNRAELAVDSAAQLERAPSLDSRPGQTPAFWIPGKIGGEARKLVLTPYAFAGEDHKSHFAVWINLPGHAATATASSLFESAVTSASRQGNQNGEITDGDTSTFRVTFDAKRAEEDWFALTLPTPVTIGRIVFAHGKTFHDGGWFDTSTGKPRIQIRTSPNGPWQTVTTLDSYPKTTAMNAAGLMGGETFEVKFPPVKAFALRIVGKPASGDNPAQSFSSCAELQAFAQ
ncbi:MAG: hypBA1 2 [Chthonomonadaceae bacterium]|nr:hypBA1 2 [Chthonomonadaceae bacterium]